MLTLGIEHLLTAFRETSVGVFLGDDQGNEVLLPNKYVPQELDMGEEIKVFVYLDSGGRPVATTLKPNLKLNEFGYLEVKQMSQHGAFLDWGLEKELMVPFREQEVPMEEGHAYVVYLFLDEVTERLVASSRVNRFLKNRDLTVNEGEKVTILVYKQTDLGFNVIVNQQYKGLIYRNEIFQPVQIGDTLEGYVKHIRPDRRLDISLQRQGYEHNMDTNVQKVWDMLNQGQGFLALTDKSDPAAIQQQLQMSKKNFKKAIGALYRQRKIRLEKDGIYLVE